MRPGVLVAGLLVLAGCQGKPSEEERLVRELEYMALVAEKNKDNCEGYARALEERFSTAGIQKNLAAVQALIARQSAEQKAAFQKQYGERITAAKRRFLPVAQRCQDELRRSSIQHI